MTSPVFPSSKPVILVYASVHLPQLQAFNVTAWVTFPRYRSNWFRSYDQLIHLFHINPSVWQFFFLHNSALTLSSNLYGSCDQMPGSAETILLASCLSKNRSVPLSPLLPRQHFAATFPRRSVGHRLVRACPGGRRDCSEIMALANFLPSCQLPRWHGDRQERPHVLELECWY